MKIKFKHSARTLSFFGDDKSMWGYTWNQVDEFIFRYYWYKHGKEALAKFIDGLGFVVLKETRNYFEICHKDHFNEVLKSIKI